MIFKELNFDRDELHERGKDYIKMSDLAVRNYMFAVRILNEREIFDDIPYSDFSIQLKDSKKAGEGMIAVLNDLSFEFQKLVYNELLSNEK